MGYMDRIIKYGIYALAFFLPVQTRLILRAGELNGGYFEYGTISLYAVDILLIVIFFLYLLFQVLARDLVQRVCRDFSLRSASFRNDKKGEFPIFDLKFIFISLFLLSALVSIFFAQDKLLAAYIFARLLSGVGLFLILIKAEYDLIKLAYFFLAGAFLQACLAIWQFLTQSSFPSKWLGLAMHDPRELGVSVVEFADERWLRAYGGLDHPNILGGVMAMSLLLLLWLFVKSSNINNQSPNNQIPGSPPRVGERQRVEAGKFQGLSSRMVVRDLVKRFCRDFSSHPLVRNDKNDILQIPKLFTFYFLLITFFTALFFSFSRNAWIGFAAGWVVLFFMGIFNKIERKSFFKASIALGVIALMLFYFYGGLVKTRISNASRLENISIEERMNDYGIFKEAIKEKWLLGTGVGNYALAVHKRIVDKPSYFYQPVHNSLALIWAELGIFGIIGFLGFFGILFYPAIKKKNFYLFLFLPVFLMMFNDHWWWSLHFGVLFFWFLAGCFLRFSEREILG